MVGDQTGMQGAMEGKGEEEDEGHRMLRKREQLLMCVHCARNPLREQGRVQVASPHIRGTVQLISDWLAPLERVSGREEGDSFPLGPSDSVSMSPSTQLAAALAEEFGVRKAVLGGLKEHQSNTGKGKRSE